MTLEVLISCMNQKDMSIIRKSNICSDSLIINQCDNNHLIETVINGHSARMISTCERGLSRSGNMAIKHSHGDICLLCDDDEIFEDNYHKKIIKAFHDLPDADVIAFKIVNQPCRLRDKVQRLFRLDLLKIKSWQIAFRRESVLAHHILFDIYMGAGTGNGAQEENKFLFDCHKAGMKIYYVPYEIASVAQEQSTWFEGFTEKFFYDRGMTTRYFMGEFLAIIYAMYYLGMKHSEYKGDISFARATVAFLKGFKDNNIYKMHRQKTMETK